MHGLGKKRTKLGKWLDQRGITQEWLVRNTKLNRNTISSLCGDDEYTPTLPTIKKVINVLRSSGYDVDAKDFWDI